MALQKITFDGASVTSKKDADLNHHLGGLIPAGIISGIRSECSVSVANNYITFQDGYVQVYGRRIYVEAGSQVYVSLDSTKYGYVVVEVNLSSNTVNLKTIETTSTSYPTLTQQDLSKTGTLYQFPIAKYKKTTSSITLTSGFTPTYIKPGIRTVNKVLKYKYAQFFDSNYESVKKVSIDASDIPYGSMLYIVFKTVDAFAFGAITQVCGSITVPIESIYWSGSYYPIRSTLNSGKDEEILIYISNSDYKTINFTLPDGTSNCPDAVYVYYEDLEGV